MIRMHFQESKQKSLPTQLHHSKQLRRPLSSIEEVWSLDEMPIQMKRQLGS